MNCYIILVLTICSCVGAQDRITEDGWLDFKGLTFKYGMECREHEVVTEDRYILKLFQIPGDRTRPVLLVHGITSSADAFIVRGNTSLVTTLSEQGYDVWVANMRGNKYSRRHQFLDPDHDKKFWNYSFHEMGVFDLPALIDHIIKKTEQPQISCIAYSLGNTEFYVLGSMRPEYNEKVKILIAMAPIAFLNYWRPPITKFLEIWPSIHGLTLALNQEEIFGEDTLTKYIVKTLCAQADGYERCVKGVIMPANGWDLEELEPEFWYVVVGHYPATASRKTIDHFLQLGQKNNFAQNDYGPIRNLVVYNSTVPPDYELNKVTMKIAMLVGANDRCATLKGAIHLMHQLPNVVRFVVLERQSANHLDFIWGKNMNTYLFPHIIELLEKYKEVN